jgi:glc operon protein GlcG
MKRFQTLVATSGAALALTLLSSVAFAQASPYGAPMDLETARKVAAAGVAEARKINVPMMIVVTDPGGATIYAERMDGVPTGSVKVAEGKARSAALFNRPTKVFEDILAAGGAGTRMLALEGAVPVGGGYPVVIGGKTVGAVGASGGSNVQDDSVGKAAAAGVH